MQDFYLSVEDAPDKAKYRSLLEYSPQIQQVKSGEPDYKKLHILARDDDSNVIGGLNGETFWGWLFIENLAVDDAFREHRLGSKLLQGAEDEARKRGCKAAYLDTYSFQALPFYEKHGYKPFGTLLDFPAGHQKIFLWKHLG